MTEEPRTLEEEARKLREAAEQRTQAAAELREEAVRLREEAARLRVGWEEGGPAEPARDAPTKAGAPADTDEIEAPRRRRFLRRRKGREPVAPGPEA